MTVTDRRGWGLHRRGFGEMHLGISRVLLLLVLVTLAPFVVLEIYRGARDVARQRQAVEVQARTRAVEEAETTDDFLWYTSRFLATLAGSPQVQAMDPEGAAALFHAVRAQNPNYANVFLLDAAGRQVASTDPGVSDPAIDERPYFRDALESGRLALSGVLILPETNRSVVVLAYPVTRPAGARAGVVAIALDIARLSSVIGYVGLPAGSLVLLIQPDGSVIATGNDVEGWVGQQQAGAAVLEAIQRSSTGVTAGVMADGVGRVIGYQRLARAPWTLVAAIPQSEVDAEVRRSLLRIAQQLALMALAVVILAGAVMRRVVAPIQALSAGARAFASGRLDRRIALERRDELGTLAQSLNSMAAALTRRLEEEAAHTKALEELNRLQTEFVATASHELRTPVAAIRSYTEALLRPDIVDPQTRQECLEGIDRSSTRLANLARTLLDVSRIDSGHVPLQPSVIEAPPVVRAAVAQMNGASGRVVLETSGALPRVYADPHRLEDALVNLISNACTFSPEDSPVTVAIDRTATGIAIAVTDRGPGISPEEQEHIFERFYHIDHSMARRAGGFGLGLYITRAYIEAMGGSIAVQSRPGEGSRFTVSLPAAAPEQAEAGRAAALSGRSEGSA